MDGLLSAARHLALLDAARSTDGIRVEDMAKTLGVSPSTIRRDLRLLEKEHLVTRVHGGALALDHALLTLEPEAPRLQRAKQHISEKRRIGRRAAGLIHNGETALIGGGTTTEAMLSFVKNRQHLTILTNNVHTAQVAAKNESLAVVVLGGYLQKEEMSLLGHLTTDPLSQLTIDKAIFGAYAIDGDGLMGADIAESETERALVTSTAQLVILADSSKFHRRGPIRLASANQLSVVITDHAAPAAPLASLRAQGVNVIQC